MFYQNSFKVLLLWGSSDLVRLPNIFMHRECGRLDVVGIYVTSLIKGPFIYDVSHFGGRGGQPVNQIAKLSSSSISIQIQLN